MIALLDIVHDADAVDDDLAAILDDLSIRSDDVSVEAGISNGDNAEVSPNDGNTGDDRDDGDSDNGNLEGLHRLGRRLHQLDEIEHLFDYSPAELEWCNEDYNHDPLVDNNREYAPDNKLSTRCQGVVTGPRGAMILALVE